MRFLKYALPVLVVSAVIVFFSQKKPGAPSEPAWLQAKGSTQAPVLLSKMAEEAVVESPNPGAPGQVSAECVDIWMRMTSSPPRDYLESKRLHGAVFARSCEAFENDIPFAADMRRTCELKDGKYADEKNCLAWYRLYRAALIDKLTIGETDYSRLPDGILISKFIGRLSARGAPALDELRKMAAEIKRRQPDNPSTYKILASLEILPEKLNAKAGAEAAEEGLRLKPADEELQSAWFYFKSQDDGFPYADFVEKHSQYPYGQYFRAAQLWQMQQKDAALGILTSLQAKYPANENFQQTMSFIQSGEANEENPFNVNFDVSKDDW